MLRFAGDTVLLAENKVDLENVLSSMEKLLDEEHGLKINKTKTKAMKTSKSENRDPLNTKIGNEHIKEVENLLTQAVLSQGMDELARISKAD